MANDDWQCWRDPNHPTTINMLGWPECDECGASPSYPERWEIAMQRPTPLGIYLPNLLSPMAAVIVPGSGVVGLPLEDSRTLIYYEGWVYEEPKEDRVRQDWERAISHAAGRLVQRYPTVATGVVQNRDVTKIGEFHPKTNRIVISDEEALNLWLIQAWLATLNNPA